MLFSGSYFHIFHGIHFFPNLTANKSHLYSKMARKHKKKTCQFYSRFKNRGIFQTIKLCKKLHIPHESTNIDKLKCFF